MSSVASVFRGKSEMINLVNKGDSLTECQRSSPGSAFESQPETASAGKIAEELLSITGCFCLLKSKVGDQF